MIIIIATFTMQSNAKQCKPNGLLATALLQSKCPEGQSLQNLCRCCKANAQKDNPFKVCAALLVLPSAAAAATAAACLKPMRDSFCCCCC